MKTRRQGGATAVILNPGNGRAAYHPANPTTRPASGSKAVFVSQPYDIPVGQIADVLESRYITVHREDPVGGDHPKAGAFRLLQFGFQVRRLE